MLSNNVQIYLKTTETCNLNCSHCFTSGKNGAKVYFNPEKTLGFIEKFFEKRGSDNCRILLHGGEPLLAPTKDINQVIDAISKKYPKVELGIQTNLVFPLSNNKLEILDRFLDIGTSWDHNIRFNNFQQMILWEKNVKKLIEIGKQVSVMISLNSDLIEDFEPIDIIQYMIDVGVQHVLFERITSNGNAVGNFDVIPDNKKLDKWFLLMYEQTMEHKLYEKIHNMFLEEIAVSFVKGQHVANRCRNCEQSLLTINADGTIAGCPNSAPEEFWGNIDLSIEENLASKKRLKTIACEMVRKTECLTCPVASYCNGDCHRLGWQDKVCAAPKSLMLKMKKESKIDDYKLLEW